MKEMKDRGGSGGERKEGKKWGDNRERWQEAEIKARQKAKIDQRNKERERTVKERRGKGEKPR